MQVIYFNNYGGLIRDIKMKGNVLEGDIVAARHPIEQNEVATKGYTDDLFSNLSVALLTTGTIKISNLPGFTGDGVSNPGENTIVLAPRGFLTDTRSKVVVDAKGMVSGLGILDNSDIPNLDWSKITSDKPTTLAGYGITDALGVSGGTLNVNVTLRGDPLQAKEAATKKYVDDAALALQSSGSVVGDLILRNVPYTPAGYLLCNGGVVRITDYSALFGVIGHLGADPGGGYFFLPNLTSDEHQGYRYYIKY